MSVFGTIPHQARYMQTASVFRAQFNVPVVGQYSFSVPANNSLIVLTLQPNSVYLIERLTFSGDVSQLDFAGALNLANIADVPTVSLRRLLDNSTIYETSLPFPSYVSQQPSSVWVKSGREGDAITATLTGSLLQTAALVGIANIRLSLSLSIYAIESTIFNRGFLSSQAVGLSDRVRG